MNFKYQTAKNIAAMVYKHFKPLKVALHRFLNYLSPLLPILRTVLAYTDAVNPKLDGYTKVDSRCR
jgi:hypothetical protein